MTSLVRGKTPCYVRLQLLGVKAAVVAALLPLTLLQSWAGGVVTSADEASLRAALAGGGTVTFAVDGRIPLSATLFITNGTTLDGSGHTVTISGSNSVRVLYINSGVQFLLENLTIADGRTNSGGGLFNSGGSVTISNCVFSNNVAIGAAGASGPGGSPGQPATGAGIYNSGTLTVLASSFIGNSAVGGAGGGGLDFGGNGADGSGGAIYSVGNANVTNCTFQGNAAVGGNGGPPIPDASPVAAVAVTVAQYLR